MSAYIYPKLEAAPMHKGKAMLFVESTEDAVLDEDGEGDAETVERLAECWNALRHLSIEQIKSMARAIR